MRKKRGIPTIVRCFHDVDSTNIKRVYWSAKFKTLVVQFHSGKYYLYPDVPMWQHRRLMKADSKGGYFAAYIRDSYQCFAFDLNDHIEGIGEAELLKQLEDSIKEIQERRNESHDRSAVG